MKLLLNCLIASSIWIGLVIFEIKSGVQVKDSLIWAIASYVFLFFVFYCYAKIYLNKSVNPILLISLYLLVFSFWLVGTFIVSVYIYIKFQKII